MTDIKLQNIDRKTEMQLYEREIVILLNMVLNFKSKHIIKGAIVQIERKLGKLNRTLPL